MLRGLAGRADSRLTSFSAAKSVDIDRQRLDRRRVEPSAPRRHDAAAADPHALHHRALALAIEPDAGRQVRRAEIAVALAVVAVAGRAIVGIDLLALGEIGALVGASRERKHV